MKIIVKNDAISGTVPIPRGEYWVSLHHESSEIYLLAGGKDIKIKATKRRSKSKTKKESIQFMSGGGRTWSLVFQTPKYGEWVAFIDIS